MMTYAEAAWVREYVWTKAMRATFAQVPAIYSKCPCQYGPCGYCTDGHHEMCPYERTDVSQTWKDQKSDYPETWIVSSRGTAYADAEVRLVGVRHDSRCSCWRARHHGADLPPVQLDLIDILAEMGVCA